MLYCEGGDLYSKIKQQNNVYIEETQVVEWFVQIAMALQVKRREKQTLKDYLNFIILLNPLSICMKGTFFIEILRLKTSF